MIPEYMEPKGLSPDTPAFDDVSAQAIKRFDATVGSARLFEALMKAQGKDPGPIQLPVRPTLRTKPRKPKILITREEAHTPACCPMCGAPKQPQMMVAHIQQAVTAYYGLSGEAMTSARRAKELAHPRQVAMYLSSELTGKSLPEIGRRFGGRDHTTVIYAIKAVKRRIETDPEIATDVAALRESLKP